MHTLASCKLSTRHFSPSERFLPLSSVVCGKNKNLAPRLLRSRVNGAITFFNADCVFNSCHENCITECMQLVRWTMRARQALLVLSVAVLSGTTWALLPVSSSCPRVPNLSLKRLSKPLASSTQRVRPCLSNNSSGSSSPENDKPARRRNPLLELRKALMSFTVGWTRTVARFRRLSRRSKAIILGQLAIVGLLLGLSVRSSYVNHSMKTSPPIEIPYSTFLDLCQGKNEDVHIANVLIGPDKIGYRLFRADTQGERRKATEKKPLEGGQILERMAYTRKVSASDQLLQHLRQHDITFSAAPVKTNYAALSAKSFILAFYALILLRMYRTMNGGSGESPGKLAPPTVGASFDDIEGIDGAKYEVMELVDTLRNPDKYSILGARAPTGLLLEGPPGTGKTMLARATAATAGVPLLYCSGSDFVEMFVGRGAARVRRTFDKAAKLAPCIIFIDELDALGKSRDGGMMMGMGGGRGNDEAEQTLNQLLACMDGLDSTRKICVMAATNRRDVLDPALVRPGRFDRIIRLELPSTLGRERILRVHATKLPGFVEGNGIDERRPGSLGKGRAVDISAVASVTGGLSGAELEFIVNEAAIRAVRRVSTELREGVDPAKIVPTVEAIDFEESVKNFFETRKPNKSVGDLFRSLKN